jgi:cation transport ATPase
VFGPDPALQFALVASVSALMILGDLGAVLDATTISQMTMRNIKQNLFWAFAYNVLLIPNAAGVFYPMFGGVTVTSFGGRSDGVV